jgi:chromosomal replication initiator protein
VSSELEHLWSLVQAELARAVDDTTYRIWLEPLRARELSAERLVVEAPAQACGWIHDRFGRVLQASAALTLGPHAVIDLVGGDRRRLTAGPPGPGEGACADPAGWHTHQRRHPTRAPSVKTDRGLASPPLDNPKLTFDQFVIGDCNRLAHAAALTVAELPSQAYNPLFICGPPGVGKTHLLSSIARLLLSHAPTLAVRYTTGEAFANEFLGALSERQTESFKLRFRHVDVLLLDDVQFLERKTKTEEEFFHTFNALHEGGRQIVLTSDRPPHDLQALEDRLRQRFAAGLVADMSPPDLATRRTILRKRAHHDGITPADPVALEVIAERVYTSVRALEGAFIRVVAVSSLTGRPLTGQLAREVLSTLVPRSSSSPDRRERSVGEIQAATCEQFGITREQLLSSARTPRVTWARQVAMYLARELTRDSLPAIGRRFHRNHATVLHAWRRTRARIASDDEARDVVERLRRACEL